MLAGRRVWLAYGGLAVMSAAGGVLAGLSWDSLAVVVGCVATFIAGAHLRIPASLTIAIRTVIAFLIAAASVNLQAAEGLLAANTLPAEGPELAQAVECNERAGTWTREGMAAARQAVLALRADAAGQAVLDPGVQQRLLAAAVRAPAAPPDGGETDLTSRESDVLRLIAAGRSNREIARALFVSEATVKTHINRIFAKTGSRDRMQAMRYAYTHGFADPAS
jgi:ATP/maltotriose-dependent transcriptional regulator MalT